MPMLVPDVKQEILTILCKCDLSPTNLARPELASLPASGFCHSSPDLPTIYLEASGISGHKMTLCKLADQNKQMLFLSMEPMLPRQLKPQPYL